MKHSILLLLFTVSCITTPLADVDFLPPILVTQSVDCTWFKVSVVNNGAVVAREVVATMMITKDDGVFKVFKLYFDECHPGVVETLSKRVAGIEFGDDIEIKGTITFN